MPNLLDFYGTAKMGDELLLQIKDVMIRIFSSKVGEIDRNTTADDVNGWDSLTHTFFIAAIEAQFAIRFDPYKVSEFSCVGDLVDEVARLIK
jgi:acyl carrier protein